MLLSGVLVGRPGLRAPMIARTAGRGRGRAAREGGRIADRERKAMGRAGGGSGWPGILWECRVRERYAVSMDEEKAGIGWGESTTVHLGRTR